MPNVKKKAKASKKRVKKSISKIRPMKDIPGERTQKSILKALPYRLPNVAYDKLIRVDELHLNPQNPNEHSEKQILLLAEIMKANGVRRPVRVSLRSGLVTVGHCQILSFNVNGWEYVPVNFQDYKDEADEWNDVVADNALGQLSEFNFSKINEVVIELGPDYDPVDMGLINFKIEPADKGGSNVNEDEQDDLPQKVKKRVKLGDVWALGEHRLLCGDSLKEKEVKALVGSQTVDMAFNDPPYGADIVQGKSIGGSKPFGSVAGPEKHKNKIIKAGRYKPIIGDKTTKTAKEAFGIAQKFTKNIITWGAQYYAEALPPSSGWLVWDKQTTGNLGDGELAYTSHKRALRIFTHQWNGLIKGSERNQRRVHPTQKPIALAEWVFENYGDPKTVLDMFGGSGSTLMACQKTGRKCFSIELDPHYCDVIIQRFEKLFDLKAEKIKGSTKSTKRKKTP